MPLGAWCCKERSGLRIKMSKGLRIRNMVVSSPLPVRSSVPLCFLGSPQKVFFKLFPYSFRDAPDQRVFPLVVLWKTFHYGTAFIPQPFHGSFSLSY